MYWVLQQIKRELYGNMIYTNPRWEILITLTTSNYSIFQYSLLDYQFPLPLNNARSVLLHSASDDKTPKARFFPNYQPPVVRETPSQNKTADGTVSPTLIYRFIKAGEGFLFAKQIPARTAGEIFAYTWSSRKRNARSSALSDSLFRKYGDLQDVLIYCRMRPNSLMERASGQVMKRAHRSAGAPSCSLHSADRHDCSSTRSRLIFRTYSFLRWKALKWFILPLRCWRIFYSQLFVGGNLDVAPRVESRRALS